jgi:transcriptional regulator with XRE-family HTH domain
MRKSINPAELAARTREKRAAYGLSIRRAAEQAGVTASAFARAESGKHVPDYDNLLLLAQWVGITLEQLPVASDAADAKQAHHTIVHSPKETTLEAIALHLRADENLESADVDLLMDVVRAAYGKLCKRHT